MISKSALFGDIQRYIYNPNTPTSVFFHFKDLEAFLNDGQIIKRPKTTQEQKNIIYEYFYKKGFITLDIFSFALNPNNTTKIYFLILILLMLFTVNLQMVNQHIALQLLFYQPLSLRRILIQNFPFFAHRNLYLHQNYVTNQSSTKRI